MNAIDLAGRGAVITGGAQGIGYAMARRFLASGARVSLWDRNGAQLDQARRTLEEAFGAAANVHTVVVDIGRYPDVEQAVRSTRAQLGRIDIFINNAAVIGPNRTLWEYPIDDWHTVVHVGVNGTFHCCRAVAPVMIDQNYGRILNVASIAGKEGNPNAAAYSAAKAGVIALTKSLGKELALYNIAVNCITPAVAKTPGAMEQSAEHIRYMLSKIPRNRFVEVEEIAAMAAWIVSEENSFTTGAVFDLSGGRATY